METVVNKVVVYITATQENASRLLVFRHTQYPDAGIQVPAGTIHPGEDPLAAARREAEEESGLANLKLVAYLGMRDFDATPYGKAQIQHRHFFHFEAPPFLPDRWRHNENDPSEGKESSYEFEFFWAYLPDGIPELSGEQGILIPDLSRSIEHAQYIRTCYELANHAHAIGNHPFGALLVKDGEVILKAENTVNTDHDVTCHAELNLVSQASRSFSVETLANCTLYTSTEPCPMCTGAIYWAGIPEIVYGAAAKTLAAMADETFVLESRVILGEGRSRVRVIGPVLEEEGLQVLKPWLL